MVACCVSDPPRRCCDSLLTAGEYSEGIWCHLGDTSKFNGRGPQYATARLRLKAKTILFQIH